MYVVCMYAWMDGWMDRQIDRQCFIFEQAGVCLVFVTVNPDSF